MTENLLLPGEVILVVDDLSSARKVLQRMLEKGTGITAIEQAGDGDLALERIKQGGIALVISDWNMPKMNGIDLLKSLRSDDKLKHIPFLMVTSMSKPSAVTEALSAGVTDYLRKPFSQEILVDKVKKALGHGEG